MEREDGRMKDNMEDTVTQAEGVNTRHLTQVNDSKSGKEETGNTLSRWNQLNSISQLTLKVYCLVSIL